MSEKALSSSPLNRLASDLGFFQLYWSHFEFYLEVISHRILQTSGAHTSIIFSGLGLQAKQQITIALLKDSKPNNYEETIRLIRTISTDASRNHLIHSALQFGGVDYAFKFVKRNIDNGFTVKRKTFTTKTFETHVDRLSASVLDLKELADISDAELETYANTAYFPDE